MSLVEDGYSPVSIHRKISSLRVFYRYLRKEGFTITDPLEKVVLPKMKKRLPVFVEEGSLDRLLDDYDFGTDFDGIRNRTIIEMLYLTGMRRAELTGLRDTDVDIPEATVKVTGKRNKQRIIPLLKPFTLRLEDVCTGSVIINSLILRLNGFFWEIMGTSCMINMFIIL